LTAVFDPLVKEKQFLDRVAAPDKKNHDVCVNRQAIARESPEGE
jgi:hypothetical protein